MSQEEKRLLLQDLCARLLYGTICEDVYGNSGLLFDLAPELNSVTLKISELGSTWTTDIDNVKPYLRPMESMTEEEWRKMHNCCNAMLMGDKRICIRKSKFGSFSELQDAYTTIDWLLAHHFDYRGLIPMGLALPAPEGMYDIKK